MLGAKRLPPLFCLAWYSSCLSCTHNYLPCLGTSHSLLFSCGSHSRLSTDASTERAVCRFVAVAASYDESPPPWDLRLPAVVEVLVPLAQTWVYALTTRTGQARFHRCGSAYGFGALHAFSTRRSRQRSKRTVQDHHIESRSTKQLSSTCDDIMTELWGVEAWTFYVL